MKKHYFKKALAALLVALFVQYAPAQQYLMIENFNGDSSNPPDNPGWTVSNNSSPLGPLDWFMGNPATTFPAFSGADSSYIAVNFLSTDSVGTISNWLLSPELDMKNGNVLRFYTRAPSPVTFADRLQVYASLSGSSTNVGTTANSIGDFTLLLKDINPNLASNGYPGTWTAYSATLSGITGTNVSGRFGFRYYVTDAGEFGNNSDYIGIDSITYFEPAPVIVTSVPATLGKSQQVSAFPNPFKSELVISGINGTAELYDVLGKLVLSVNFKDGKPINTGPLEKGIYVARIVNEDEVFVKTQKLNKE